MKSSEIQIRDPFVYVEKGMYYLYGSTDRNIWSGEGQGFTAYKGNDLENWEEIGNVFDRPESFWGTENFWAPEMHAYRGAYYLFASFKAPGFCRGTAILKADSPEGPFRPWGEERVTPADWECLDGTLYVEDGVPYVVFCHEWLQVGDGEICVVRLREDLSGSVGEVRTLFTASRARWTDSISMQNGQKGYITDGPNLFRNADGRLYMLWSSKSASGYAIGLAESDNGRIDGVWTLQDRPVFDRDGGHGMIFCDLQGQLRLTIHAPNQSPDERPLFLPICETADGIECIV